MLTTVTASDYSSKPNRYFSGARIDFINELPKNDIARLLEIGCGNGDTAAYALATKKCAWACGVELCSEPATEALRKLQAVHVGDIEQMDLPYREGHFDVLVMSEVIEHLRDPWEVLRRLRNLLSPGALVLCGSPNVAHHSVLRMLWKGRWDYAPVGIMDRTHLRWFTPATYSQLFSDCGYNVIFCGPANRLRKKAALFNFVTGGRLRHLLHPQIYLKAFRP
jgi:2-polyprenyl-3-methyl-5-hydroxy-6-metoxy-1,4-benzoquinol methylase